MTRYPGGTPGAGGDDDGGGFSGLSVDDEESRYPPVASTSVLRRMLSNGWTSISNRDLYDADESQSLTRARSQSIGSIVSSVISDIRSDSDGELLLMNADAERYDSASPFGRAFPERFIALLVTLAIEIPVVLLITGGSDELSNLMGVKKYAILMAFLPLASAISGNVGLQCSTLTTRAISHSQVTVANFRQWMTKELMVASLLAVSVAAVVGSISALWVFSLCGEFDPGFAITISFAQFLSIIVAGLSGSCGPLVFTFVFGKDSGKWAGPLETAIQDIAGAFCMTKVAVGLLKFFISIGLSPSQ
jgi:Mg/Co/Ni transporter MgtE